MAWMFWVLAAAALAPWLMPRVEAWWCRWSFRRLEEEPYDPAVPLPRVSVVVAALNEEETVEAAMRSMLAMDYPDLEIVAVDDRSTDGTGAILDRLAAEDGRLRAVHVRELPAGWLGKNHALHVGSQQAGGTYLLFTDADVHFERDALRRAVHYAETRGRDHVAVFPELDGDGFWEAVVVGFFGVIFLLYTRPWKTLNSRSKAHIGVGAFNLVRTEVYRRAGGHAALPMDVADDLKLGKRMKQAGARSEALGGIGLMRVRWAVGVRGLIHGLTKNMFAGFHYNPLLAAAAVVGLLIMGVWPVVGLWFGPLGARGLCAAVFALMLWFSWTGRLSRRTSRLTGLCYPIGAMIMVYIILRSMAVTYRQGGVIWRGTHYPIEELRKRIV